jgi:quinol-cytochrome oxidoreductase complex cytochrome b subunit
MVFNHSSRVTNGMKPVVLTISNHFLYYPTPNSLNYNWSFGSLAGLFFALQIVTGIFLAMHYTPHVEWAFASVEHIMTDVTGGYMFRYFHANGASMIFILIYLHIARNLYYQSYVTRPVLWNTGIVIFLLMMATAFIGYVLPWGQMSFWGATVITSLVTAVPFVGETIAHWVWGGFSISNATLVRFYALHFTLPFVVLGVIMGHLVVLHTAGSSDPLALALTPGKIPFHPYFTLKDAYIFSAVFSGFIFLTAFQPNLLGHPDNFLPANPLVTPAHIVPEWYFTPFYAILRACPNKLGGAIGMFAAILLMFAVPYISGGLSPDALMVSAAHSTPHKIGFWVFSGVFLTLMVLGMRPAEAPYVFTSKLITGLYFAYFLLYVPVIGWLTRQLLDTVTSTTPTEQSVEEEHENVL